MSSEEPQTEQSTDQTSESELGDGPLLMTRKGYVGREDGGRNQNKRQKRKGNIIQLQEGHINHEYQLYCLSNIHLDPVAKTKFCASDVVTPKDADVINKTYVDEVTAKTMPWRPIHKFLWRRVVLDDRFVWLAVFGPSTTMWIQDQHRRVFPDGGVIKNDAQEEEFEISNSFLAMRAASSRGNSLKSGASPKASSSLQDSSKAGSPRKLKRSASGKIIEGKPFESFVPQIGTLEASKSDSIASFGDKFQLARAKSVSDVKNSELLKQFHWRRVTYDSYFAMAPSLHQAEIEYLDKLLDFEQDVLQQRMLLQHSSNSIEEIMKTREFAFNKDEKIKHVVLLVVVLAEVAPILDNLKFEEDEEANEALGGLAYCYSGKFGGYKLTVAKVSESDIFSRHYSGYTQVAGIAALTAKLLQPSLVVSFGTAGGVPPTVVGGVVLASGCLFLDRTRTSSAGAFSWGIWGGGTVKTPNLAKRLEDFSVKYAPCASQISYAVSQLSMEKIKAHNVACLDMEAASEAQILNQMNCNFIAMKVISNGVYPGEPKKMESEYHDNRELVSRRATAVLMVLFQFLDGKTISEL